MKTSSTKKKRPTTRAARRGMTLAEWRRQNQWPELLDGQTSLRLTDWQTAEKDWQTADSQTGFLDYQTADCRLSDNTSASEPKTGHLSASLNGRSSESRDSLLSLPSREVRRTKFNSPKVCQSKKDSSASLNSLKVCQSIRDSYGRICGLHPEDAALIAQLWDASGHRGIHIRTLAAMYFPDAVNSHCAVAQLSYELRCCHGLTEALERLHHPKQFHRFTCAQVRQIFLLYGSPGT